LVLVDHVTIRLQNVEQVLCPSPNAGKVLVARLYGDNPAFVERPESSRREPRAGRSRSPAVWGSSERPLRRVAPWPLLRRLYRPRLLVEPQPLANLCDQTAHEVMLPTPPIRQSKTLLELISD
jgi:hypothetical protein